MNGRENRQIWSRYAIYSNHLLLREKSRGWEATAYGLFLWESQPTDPPNTLRNILPSISVAINAKHKCWFLQLTQFHYLSCNHMIHPVFHHIPIQIEDPSTSSPTHPFNTSFTFHYIFIINTVICQWSDAGFALITAFTELLRSIWNKEEQSQQWKEPVTMYLTRVIKLTAVIIKAHHHYQFHIKFYLTFFSPYLQITGNHIVGINITDILLIRIFCIYQILEYNKTAD